MFDFIESKKPELKSNSGKTPDQYPKKIRAKK